MSMKAIIVFGTRGGATTAIAEEIGKALAEQGYETTVRDVRNIRDINVKTFDLVIAGSSVWAAMWTRKASGFLKKNQSVLANKKVALFASGLSGADPTQRENSMKNYLEKAAAKYPAITPISLGLFGGYMDFNGPGLAVRLIGGAIKKDLQKKGVDTAKPYDTRDFAAIHQWAVDVAIKAR
jgi:menaquinone-dependent protoporphyrinogen oxidase